MEIYQGYYTPTPGPNKPYMFNAIPSMDKSTWKFTVSGLDNANSFSVTNEEFDNFKKKVLDNNLAWKSVPEYPGTWTSYDFGRSMNAKQMISDPNNTTREDWERYVREGVSTRKQKRNRRSSRRKPTKRRGSRRGNRKTKKSRKRTVYVGGMGGMFSNVAFNLKKLVGKTISTDEQVAHYISKIEKNNRWHNITLWDPVRKIPFAVYDEYGLPPQFERASIKGKWGMATFIIRARPSHEATYITDVVTRVFKDLDNNVIHRNWLPHGVTGEQPTYKEWEENPDKYPIYDETIHNPSERRPGRGERPTDSLLGHRFDDV